MICVINQKREPTNTTSPSHILRLILLHTAPSLHITFLSLPPLAKSCPLFFFFFFFPLKNRPLFFLCSLISVKLAIDNQETLVNPNNTRIMSTEEGDNRWPPWLKPLLNERFFVQCQSHADFHKSECNMYCLDCLNGALCSLCVAHHRNHRVIQIRRSSYHDVIRVNEIQKVLDITGVQTYIINSAKVVFLNERPQPKPGKGVTYTCEVCDRSLVDSCRFCSLGCKISGTSKKNPKRKPNSLEMESEDSYNSSTTSSHGGKKQNKNKAQSFSPSTPPPMAASFRSSHKRRKGIPHRSPLTASTFDY
ncbi:hypothetical protein V2J09_020361 [Rumex salicifolius]